MAFDLAALGALFFGAKWPAEAHTRMSAKMRKIAPIPARVLIIDDEPQVRTMIAATLERQGYDVRMAASGREAIELLRKNDFDLVLTEIAIRDWNGITLMEDIQKHQPQLPVVMVTAVHEISVAIDSMHRERHRFPGLAQTEDIQQRQIMIRGRHREDRVLAKT